MTFIPVKVERGRKFRGQAYSVGAGEYSTVVAWNVVAYSVKLWDPASMRYVYANSDFVEPDASVPQAKIDADKAAYLANIFNGTKEWCLSKQPGISDEELQKFTRNCLRKQHPELQAEIDAAFPDKRNAADEIRRTLEWASTLKTRPCWMYGKFCPGGKPFSKQKIIDTARRALVKKGVDKLPGFEAAWAAAIAVD